MQAHTRSRTRPAQKSRISFARFDAHGLRRRTHVCAAYSHMKEPNTPQLLRVIPKPTFSLEKLSIYAIDLRNLLDNCLAFDLHYIPSNGIDRIESQQKRRPRSYGGTQQ